MPKKTEEIKKAVKDALDDKRMDDISTQLTSLATQMTKGFAEVHTRQDIANGKLLRHENELALIKSNAIPINKFVYGFIGITLVTILGVILNHVLKP